MPRADLVADCASCAALCCVAPSFEVSEDFAIAKAAGEPCPHLTHGFRCTIHDHLAARGFSGCAIYTCYGAGQRATAVCAGQPVSTTHAAFLALRALHEMLWLLTEAARLVPASRPDLAAALSSRIDALDALAKRPPATWIEVRARALRQDTDALLRQVGDALGGRQGRP